MFRRLFQKLDMVHARLNEIERHQQQERLHVRRQVKRLEDRRRSLESEESELIAAHDSTVRQYNADVERVRKAAQDALDNLHERQTERIDNLQQSLDEVTAAINDLDDELEHLTA